MAQFREVADRVWTARHDWADVNVTAVAGTRGLVVIDTHASAAAGRVVAEELRSLGAGDVCAVVNTHWHWDHVLGNAAFHEEAPEVPVHAHEACAAALDQQGAQMLAQLVAEGGPHAGELTATEVVVPNRVLSSVSVIDLGDRLVELVHPGRGHTDGDLVVHVPDADLLVAGDLVEQSGAPAVGDDSWPLDWPPALDTVLGMISTSTLVVPGHGTPVDRDFVEAQRNEIGLVVEQARHLASEGVPVGEAVAAGDWPWGADHPSTEHAVRRIYAHLPRSHRQLPLV